MDVTAAKNIILVINAKIGNVPLFFLKKYIFETKMVLTETYLYIRLKNCIHIHDFLFET